MLEPDEYKVIPVKSWREATADVVAPGRKFLLFVAMDFEEEDRDVVFEFAKACIHRGCRGMTAWGRNCHVVGTEFAWANAWIEMHENKDIGHVSASGTAEGTLEESLWYFLRPMANGCDQVSHDRCAMIGMVEDREDWLARVREVFADPDEFCSEYAKRKR